MKTSTYVVSVLHLYWCEVRLHNLDQKYRNCHFKNTFS